ncbi:Aldo/keto reductase [Myriangium duriaei CBS 260.36]|uniref:Aldo/keto reductase n=1 Tax=Myriangium duriaei CBS 260.36 TaxID=1168546 RepID=A0A9P4MLI5_9PEZI|nr:Aldo/keto reductase [Myriangium duriaei CBS 260.36]
MVKVVFGLMGSGPHITAPALADAGGVQKFLDVCNKHKIRELDTAAAYKGSESLLGQVDAAQKFIVSTKAPAFSPHSLASDKIISNCNKSLQDLKTDKVDIYYLHGPDHSTPLEEQCDAMGKLYAEGKFQRFGVSNISPQAVRTIHEYCKSKGYCLPKVYQGSYNPLQRQLEIELFPVLRELDMKFYAYSPLAGGIFAKKLEDILSPAAGDRFDVFPVFKRYLTDDSIPALRKLHQQCDEEGVGILEANLRWFKHHSGLGEGDAYILGATKPEQLERTLALSEGLPLSDGLAKAFEGLWEATKASAASYHF